MSLETPEKIRNLQRKLYRKAKAEPAALYRRLEELDAGIADRTKNGNDNSDWIAERNAVAAALERLSN
jgi:hypothetical protein